MNVGDIFMNKSKIYSTEMSTMNHHPIYNVGNIFINKSKHIYIPTKTPTMNHYLIYIVKFLTKWHDFRQISYMLFVGLNCRFEVWLQQKCILDFRSLQAVKVLSKLYKVNLRRLEIGVKSLSVHRKSDSLPTPFHVVLHALKITPFHFVKFVVSIILFYFLEKYLKDREFC